LPLDAQESTTLSSSENDQGVNAREDEALDAPSSVHSCADDVQASSRKGENIGGKSSNAQPLADRKPGKESFYSASFTSQDKHDSTTHDYTIAPLEYKPKDLILIPHLVALALQADGWWLRSDIIWHKPNPMPESVRDRCSVAHEYVFMLTKSAHYWYDVDVIRTPLQPKTFTAHGCAHLPQKGDEFVRAKNWSDSVTERKPKLHPNGEIAGANRRTVWTVSAEPKPFSHFAMFPQALIEPMILAGCPDTVCGVCGAGYARSVEREANYTQRQNRGQPNGKPPQVDSSGWQPATVHDHGFTPTCDCNASTSRGIVLDPFMGSGTTALVAQRLGRDFIGCDLNPDYVTLANKRVQYHGDDRRMIRESAAGVQQLELFG
jgi:DNA modification methylase